MRIADINRAKVACDRGHPLRGHNLKSWETGRGYRGCRACHAAWSWANKRRRSGRLVTEEEIRAHADRKAAEYLTRETR